MTENEIKPTTALRKIAGLKKRIWGLQGGQGAGKTFSALLILLNHAQRNKAKEIYIVSAELSKMRITVVKDCVKILTKLGVNAKVTGELYGSPRIDFPNKSFIQFIGLDKDDIGKGLRSDICFINEANKVSFEAYRELTGRAQRVIIDFNPNSKFWFHTEVMTRNDCDYLNLTFLDNEYLSDAERGEILRYKERGYDVKGNIINQYWANMWRVYGLGEVGQVEGRIYTWRKVPYEYYLKINKPVYYGCDWGKVDPWAIVEGKYHDGTLYLHELNYASENEIERTMSPELLKSIKSGDNAEFEGLIPYIFKKCGIAQDKMIICDTNRPNKIRTLRRAGWEYAVGVGGKLDLVNRISLLSGLDIAYTDCSKNIEMEQENYCYDKDKEGKQLERPVDAQNHTLDSSAYLTQYLFNEGIINTI